MITLDSNIWISGFAFRGRPHRILEMAADGVIDVAVSDAILTEVERILNRKFHWPLMTAKEAVETIRMFTTHVAPTEALDVVPRDKDDNAIVECAVASGSTTIVTHDKDLLSLGEFRGIKIQTAEQFLTEFHARGR